MSTTSVYELDLENMRKTVLESLEKAGLEDTPVNRRARFRGMKTFLKVRKKKADNLTLRVHLAMVEWEIERLESEIISANMKAENE